MTNPDNTQAEKPLLAAEVTMVFRVPNLCTQADLDDGGISFEEMVRQVIAEEGIFGVEDWSAIVSVKEWRS